MSKILTTVLFVFLLRNNLPAQDFGCYDFNSGINYTRTMIADKAYKEGYSIFKEYIDSPLNDGYYEKYVFDRCENEIWLSIKGLVQVGKPIGRWKFLVYDYPYYYENGLKKKSTIHNGRVIVLEGDFSKGKQVGVWKEYSIDSNGDTNLWNLKEYEDGELNGKVITYYSDGTKDLVEHYENGKLNGKAIKYFSYGTEWRILYYKDGLIHGKHTEYSIDKITGEKYTSEIGYYIKGELDGQKIVFSCLPYDTLRLSEYRRGVKHGRFLYYNTGFELNYKFGKLDGRLVEYHDNGKLFYKMDFKNNLPYNLHIIKDSSGNILDENTLVHGTGKLNWYSPNGQLLSSFTYKDQMLSGEFICLYESGEIREKGMIYTDTSYNFKKPYRFSTTDDINIFTVRQLSFTKGTDTKIFNTDSTLSVHYYVKFSDSLNDEILIAENYWNDTFLGKTKYWKDLKFGEVKRFTKGKLVSKGNYKIIDENDTKKSVKDGVFTYYFSNGSVKAQISYKSDEIIGESKYFDEDGKLVRLHIVLENGVEFNVFNGDTVNYTDSLGRKQGKWISLSSHNEVCNQRLTYIQYYKNDKPVGVWKEFSYDGKEIREEVEWIDTNLTYVKYYYMNGYLESEGFMLNEIRKGIWKHYDPKNNFTKWEGEYVCGARNGIWTEYRKNGKIKKYLKYDDGVLIESSKKKTKLLE
jgi:antitoxin component YwqK of YwqJK toxin-antitoxin module